MKIKAIILTAIIFMMSFAVCSAKNSPADSMKVFCNAVYYLNEADLKILNSSPEKMKENYRNIFEDLNQNVKFTEEQKTQLADALIEQMQKKIKFNITTESENENKAVVAVEVSGIKIHEALSSIEIKTDLEQKDMTEEKVAELVANEILNRIKNISPKSPVTVKFNLAYKPEADLWIPAGNGEKNLNPLLNAAF